MRQYRMTSSVQALRALRSPDATFTEVCRESL